MKGLQFTTNEGKKYEIYNTTENMIHAVEVNKKGEKRSPNAKTLFNIPIDTFSRFIGMGIIANA
jgi:hypothetical protein